MEKIINVNVEKLPEGVFLITSEDVQGLVVQGNTISEALEIAQDVAKDLIDFQKQQVVNFRNDESPFTCPLIVNI